MLRALLFPPSPGLRASVGLLAVRVVAGTAFMFHGWSKIKKPFSWMGPDAPYPGILQALAALSEFGGGAALVLGALVPIASFGIACTMAVAMMTHINKGDPFVGRGGSWELASVYLAIAVLMLTVGPGSFSFDALCMRRRDKK